jgi:glycosyltransferase involved in cell wall biosynthesis
VAAGQLPAQEPLSGEDRVYLVLSLQAQRKCLPKGTGMSTSSLDRQICGIWIEGRMKVTVGISFFNSEKTLGAAMRSVLAQSRQDWELILVNDGSTDRSLEIARSIRDPRVRVVSDGENLGFATRLNQITRMASGEYIARMDADDLMHPERLEVQARYLDAHPEVDVVGSSCFLINASNRVLGLGHTTPIDARPIAALRKSVLLHPSCMGRRAWFEQNAYDESMLRAQDAELWIRTLPVSNFARIDRPLLYYRITGAQSTRAYLAKSFRGLLYHLMTVRRYGPALVGHVRSYLLMARIGLFHLTLTPFALLNKQATLIHRRSRSLDSAERESAQQIVAQLHRVEEPDLTGRPPRFSIS